MYIYLHIKYSYIYAYVCVCVCACIQNSLLNQKLYLLTWILDLSFMQWMKSSGINHFIVFHSREFFYRIYWAKKKKVREDSAKQN